MRSIAFEQIVNAVERLCIGCGYDLPQDVLTALKHACEAESNPCAKRILGQLVENAQIAEVDRIPLCQDTGLTVVFVQQGADVKVEPPQDTPVATLIDAIQAGVASGYDQGLLRKSIIEDPLNQ